MNIRFFKYQGAGNDFIVIDNRAEVFPENNENLVNKLCNRRFGIGADGLMLLNKHASYDFEMKYYNADGKIGTMCGNGGRCMVAFAKKLEIFDNKTDFLASDGHHYAEYFSDSRRVKLGMIAVNEVQNWNLLSAFEGYFLQTGSPHLVIEVENLKDFDVFSEGEKLRHHPDFAPIGGTNVNFVEKKPGHDHAYALRTFERGVEDETYACGTGATAAAIAMIYKQGKTGTFQIPVEVLGGELTLYFDYDGNVFKDVYLEGPAEFVFEGTIHI